MSTCRDDDEGYKEEYLSGPSHHHGDHGVVGVEPEEVVDIEHVHGFATLEDQVHDLL